MYQLICLSISQGYRSWIYSLDMGPVRLTGGKRYTSLEAGRLSVNLPASIPGLQELDIFTGYGICALNWRNTVY